MSAPLRSRTIAITGANAGLGFFAAARFAEAGARVVLLCRDLDRASAAAAALRARVPGARLDVIRLDTADPASPAEAGAELVELGGVDGLVLNAGIVHTPRSRRTAPDGRELVLATNVLGHVRLVEAALPALEGREGARVVALGSIATRLAPFRLDDLDLTYAYGPWQAYAQSKIALSAFAYELNRRLVDGGSGVRSLVAHPGYSISGRTPVVPGVNEPGAAARFVDNLQASFTQGKDEGAQPTVRAMVDADAAADLDAGLPVLFGPHLGVKGRPVRRRPAPVTTDPRVGRVLWDALEDLAGVGVLARR